MHHHLFSQHPYDGHLGCNPHRYQVWYDVKSLLLVQFLNICHIPIRHLGKSIEFKIVQRVLFKFTMYYMINRFCVLFHSIPMPSCTLAPSLKGEHVFQRFGDRHEGAGDLIFHPACMIFKSHHLKKGRAWGKTNYFPLVTAFFAQYPITGSLPCNECVQFPREEAKKARVSSWWRKSPRQRK